MLITIIETIASTLAEHFAGKAAKKGLQKAGKAQGWIALAILLILFAFLIGMGAYLILSGVWYIGVLMLVIAGMLVYISVMSVVKERKQRKEKSI